MTFWPIALNVFVLAVLVIVLIEICRLRRQTNRQQQQLQTAIEELKGVQLKLIETGKKSAVAALSAGLLHQISQPITAIHGFVRFMKKEMKQENLFYRPVCVMDEQVNYLKQMLENLMEMVRHRKIQKIDVDVNQVVERALNLLNDELRIRRIGWDMHLAPHCPRVFADPLHLQQIFMNLVVNATEALSEAPAGTPRTLEVKTQWDKAGNRVAIYFKDNGPGMSAEVQERIFDPFFTTKASGTGIGLALCYDLVTEHGGGIDVKSNPDGTVFTVYLPANGEKK